jgi:hypothetical protein
MELKNIILSEIKQICKEKYCMGKPRKVNLHVELIDIGWEVCGK